MKKIGLYGGTFNPVHNGHIKIALFAKSELSLDEVIFIPSGTPPHKSVTNDVSGRDRIRLLNIALQDHEGLSASDIELDSIMPSYSYMTIEGLHERYPDSLFYFIIGEDSLRYLHNWKEAKRIVSLSRIVVARRNEENSIYKDENKYSYIKKSEKSLDDMILFLKNEIGGEYIVLDMPPYDSSSTMIRDAIREKKDLPDFTEEKTIPYIREHGLYLKEIENIEIERIRESLKEKLKPKRYYHTLGVAHTASALAMRYSYPVSHAYTAGLLHDCTKYLKNEEQIEYLLKEGIEVTEGEKKAPSILHAKTGAIEARKVYKIKDKAILHAILVHTTGCENMSLLDKIIFTADYIESGRHNLNRLTDIRETAFFDLDLAVTMILYDTINYLKDKEKSMDISTLKTFEYYKELIDNRKEKGRSSYED